MVVFIYNYFIKYEKVFVVVVMFYFFDSYEYVYWVFDGLVMGWLGLFVEKQGFVIFVNWEWGFCNLINNKWLINQFEDVWGLKICVLFVVGIEVSMQVLGVEVSKIGFNELLMVLVQGVIDGQENLFNVIYYFKLYEVQKYFVLM